MYECDARCGLPLAMPQQQSPRTDSSHIHIDTRIEKALEIVLSRIGESLSVSSIAREICVSPSRLRRLFRDHTGQSPLKTFKSLKLEEAARLLTLTQLSVKEVALKTGFQDVSHFMRDFHRSHGTTPIGYRRLSKIAGARNGQ